MKWLALLLILLLQVSCTTLANRRDLYSPEPGEDSREAMKQWAGNTKVTTTTTTTHAEEIPPPEFR